MKTLLTLIAVFAAICAPAQLVTNTPTTNAPAKKHPAAPVIPMNDVQKNLNTISNRMAMLKASKKKLSDDEKVKVKRLELQVEAKQITELDKQNAIRQLNLKSDPTFKEIDRQIAELKLQDFDIRQRNGLPHPKK